MTAPARIAVIADAHFHDVTGDFGTSGVAVPGGRLTLEPLGDTLRSIRLRNESGPALRFALDAVLARGIGDVILLGDYTDDGQRPSVRGLARLLDTFRARGLRFHALPGNHDMFGPFGRDRTNRFLSAEGYDLVTSDPAAKDRSAARILVTDAMRCDSVAAALAAIPDLGYTPRAHDLHWETPFGADPDLGARTYPIGGQDHVDASYLTEPVAGLWCLMIDANVFLPDGQGGWGDPTDAGWPVVLAHRPYLLNWIANVATRAKALGKALIAFSHYPVLDPMRATGPEERALFGESATALRIPPDAVARRMLATGIRLHFSGHLHVNDTARFGPAGGGLVNIAVPSLVGYPGAFKVVTVADGMARIETVSLDTMPMPPDVARIYADQVAQTGKGVHLLDHTTYGPFLAAHIRHLVPRRYLRRNWPKDLIAMMTDARLADLAGYSGADLRGLPDLPALTFLEDWYRLRSAGDLARAGIPADHLAAYHRIADAFAAAPKPALPAIASRLAAVFAMFTKYANGLPTGDIRVDLATGDMSRV